MADKEKKPFISRRNFLILLGVGGGVAVGVKLGVPFGRLKLAEFLESSGGPGGIRAEPDAWFEITPENRVRLFLPKVEMGQGIHTALAQIAVEELGVDWDLLDVLHAPTGQGLDDPVGTSASNSVSGLYQPLREAAAVMREMLLRQAARILEVSKDQLLLAGGSVSSRQDSGISISLAEIAARVAGWELPDDVPALKSPSAFDVIGSSVPRVDLREKILGSATFGYDARLPGMLYGAVARPPRLGARLLSAGPGEARSRSGVVEVLIEEDFAGVVAESREQAYAALDSLSLSWDEGSLIGQEDIEALVTVGVHSPVVIQQEGNAPRILAGGIPYVAEYRTPMAYHAHQEPEAALADVRADAVEVWTSTQSAMGVRRAVADAIGRKDDEVTVIPTYLGGGFGHKIDAQAAVEAARLSAAVGRPVHVGWSREEDFQHSFVRPPTHHRLQATTVEGGAIEAIEHQQASGDVAFSFLPGIAAAIMGADFAAWRGATIPYAIPHRRTIAEHVKLPVPTGWWRGLGLFPNVFAVESFIDELAAQHGIDPVEYRLAHLGTDADGQRIRAVVEDAAHRSGWFEARSDNTGYGFAWCIDVGTIVALVARVMVDGGEIRVEQIHASVDPGLVINPGGVRDQVLGAITMGVSATLKEEALISDGRLVKTNFSQYPLLTMPEAPRIEINIISGDDEPHGMGEPPIGPVAAAIANAVYDLTGTRLRTLPLRL